MKKLLSLLLILALTLSLVPISFAASNTQILDDETFLKLTKPEVNFSIKDKDGNSDIYLKYVLHNLVSDEQEIGYTKNGKIKVKINDVSTKTKEGLKKQKTNDQNTQYVDYALRVFSMDGQVGFYFFSVPVIKDKTKVTEEKLITLLNLHKKAHKLDKEISLTLEQGKTNKNLTKADKNNTVTIAETNGSVVCNVMDSDQVITKIAEVHSAPGLEHKFRFETSSEVTIDVMSDVAGYWKVSGSKTEASSHYTDHNNINPSSTYGFSAYDYWWYDKYSCFDTFAGLTWKEIRSDGHTGKAGDWGYHTANNMKPVDDVINEVYGHWGVVTSTGGGGFRTTDGNRFSSAATYTKGGVSVGIGLSTYYETTSAHDLSSLNGKTFYHYDLDKSGKIRYITY